MKSSTELEKELAEAQEREARLAVRESPAWARDIRAAEKAVADATNLLENARRACRHTGFVESRLQVRTYSGPYGASEGWTEDFCSLCGVVLRTYNHSAG